MFTPRLLMCTAALLALAACAPDFDPPLDYEGGYLMDSDRSRTVTVAAGDSLYSISRRYDIPTKVIADRNGLQPPFTLTAGQTLILDPTRIHVAKEGDTLASVSRQYDVDVAVLASANELPMPYRLHAGQELWIPDPFTNAGAPARSMASASPASSDLPPIIPAPINNAPIQSETLPPLPGATVAPFGSAPVAAATAPVPADAASAPLSSPVTLPSANAPVAAAASAVPAPAVSAPSAAVPPPAAVPAPAAPPEQEVAIAVPRSAIPDPAPRASTRFSWPVNGKVVARFGPAGKGLHNDGINIAAPLGTQVRAADNGVVAYAGNELKGFGNLLLIKHAGGWTTAYGHNQKLLVKRGDKVTQGQVIATVGKTGNVDGPQLHFEVRKGTQAMDPMEYLAAGG